MRRARLDRRLRILAAMEEWVRDARSWWMPHWNEPVTAQFEDEGKRDTYQTEAVLSWLFLGERVDEASSCFWISGELWKVMAEHARRLTPRGAPDVEDKDRVTAEDVIDQLLDEIARTMLVKGVKGLAPFFRKASKAGRAHEPSGEDNAVMVLLGEYVSTFITFAEELEKLEVPTPRGSGGWTAFEIALAFLNDPAFVNPIIDRWEETARHREQLPRLGGASVR